MKKTLTLCMMLLFCMNLIAQNIYTKITSINDLSSGDRVILVGFDNSNEAYAMSYQKTNNRHAVGIQVSANNVTTNVANNSSNVTEPYEFIVEEDNGVWTFYDPLNEGYLYAASSSNNLLRTQSTNNANGKWTIEFNGDGTAMVTAQGENTHNIMRFNPNEMNNAPLFGCYNSSSIQTPVYIFKCVYSSYYYITASATAGGSISPSGAIVVQNGGNKTFTITPNTNYAIESVLVDGVSVGAVSTYTFQNVTTNHTIKATFRSLIHHITASASSGGTINPSGNITVIEGENKTFAITPNTNYAIESVLVDGVSVGAVSTYTFQNVTTNHTIEATFRSLIHHITASASSGGTINPSGNIAVVEGESQTFEISPTGQWECVIDSVIVDNMNVGSVTTYTFQNVTEDHSIFAYFSPNLNPWDGITITEPFSIDNTYYIYSPTELAWVAQQTNNGNSFSGKSIYIMNDLDLGGTQTVPSTWIPIGTSSHSFKGVVNGNDNIIRNLYCNNSGNDNVGLFGYIEDASISNIQLRDVNVVGHSNVGGLIGYLYYNSSVEYCSVTGTVTGSGENVGGLIGYGCNRSSYSNIELTNCFAIIQVDANENAGGLIGKYNYSNGNYYYTSCILHSSFSAGYVHSQGVSGGLVGLVDLGYNSSYYGSLDITNCYSNTTVTGSECGGLIGGRYAGLYYGEYLST